MANKSGNGFIIGAMLGAALGAVGGILFAPKKGEETRKELKSKFDEMNSQPGGVVGGLQEKGKEVAEQVKEFGQTLKTQADQKIQQFTNTSDKPVSNSSEVADETGEKKRRFFKGV